MPGSCSVFAMHQGDVVQCSPSWRLIGIDHVSPVSSLITSSPLTYILGVSNPFGSTSIRTTDSSPRRTWVHRGDP